MHLLQTRKPARKALLKTRSVVTIQFSRKQQCVKDDISVTLITMPGIIVRYN